MCKKPKDSQKSQKPEKYNDKAEMQKQHGNPRNQKYGNAINHLKKKTETPNMQELIDIRIQKNMENARDHRKSGNHRHPRLHKKTEIQ